MIAHSMSKGGMERQLATFLHNFDRNKLDITLALFKNQIEYDLPPDVKIVDLKKGRRFSPFFAFRLGRLITSRQYNVINCKLSTISHYIMLLCALLFKSNLIIEVRTSGRHLQPFFKTFKLFYSLSRQKWELICNSKRACLHAEQYLSPAAHIEYIGNGINTELFKKQEIGSKQCFSIGYVGRILPLKNIETLINAFSYFHKEIPASELTIIGNINDKFYFRKLENLVRDLDLGDKVKFREPTDEIEKFYNSLDLFVLPSIYEGTPNVLLEAMSCECICLISQGSNSDNFLPKEFIFETKNVNQLYNKISMVHSFDEDRFKEIGRENRNIIMKRYSVNNMVNQLTKKLMEKAT